MLSFDKLCNKSKVFAILTGVKLEQFHEIAKEKESFREVFQDKTLADEILLIILYYRFTLLSILCELSIFWDAV